MDNIIISVEEFRPLLWMFLINAVLAFVLLVGGLWLIRISSRAVVKLMVLRGIDESLHLFLKNIYSLSLQIVLLITVISILGIQTTSFIAVIGSAGLAVGLALQGSLSNLAGGVLLLTVKPFRKGDFINSSGDTGTVQAINLFNTILRTPDNQTIHIPNGKLAGSTITNFSQEPIRRLVINIGISYGENLEKAKAIIKGLIDEEGRILTDPAPQVIINGFNDSSINLAMRVWVKKEDYWEINFAFHERIKNKFDEHDIIIPFPQRDVHIYEKKVMGNG